MKKGLYILGLIAFLVVFAACEKCEKPVFTEDPFVGSNRGLIDDDYESEFIGNTKSELDAVGGVSPISDGGITDPDEDEDFDGIVDPDEDEDFDKDGDGK